MHVLVTDAAAELSLELIRQLTASGHRVTGLVGRPSQAELVSRNGAEPLEVDPTNVYDMELALEKAGAKVILNLAPQRSNTLLHDGHAWRNSKNSLPAQTSALLKAANENDISFLIHAGYAFLYGPAASGGEGIADETTHLNSPPKNKLFTAAIAAEKMVTANKQFPVCMMRFGYLYGPQSNDLALYEKSFKLRRPYYAGPKKHVGNFVHFDDAAKALCLAVEKQPADEIINIVDGTAVSFGTFIDYYANCLGHQKPRRIPSFFIRLAPLFITPQQIKQLDIHAAQVDNSKARTLLGWTPQFPSYKQGLAQTVRVWRGQKD